MRFEIREWNRLAADKQSLTAKAAPPPQSTLRSATEDG